MNMKLLSLALFCTEKGQADVSPVRALRRIEWAMDQVALALRKPESAPGMALADTGFCSVILVGPDGAVQNVHLFDVGYCALVSPDGCSVSVTPKDPKGNAQACLEFLDSLARYCKWCMAVEMAADKGDRIPVLEGTLNIPSLHEWVGQKAYALLQRSKVQTHERAVGTAMKAPTFEEELIANVKNHEALTSIAPSGHDVE